MNRSFGLPVILFGVVIAVMQSQIVVALTPVEIAEKAQQITVRIDGPDEPSSGSGIIDNRQGNTYYVITSAHVVAKKGNYTISTPDGKRYPINHSQAKIFRAADLAVLQFTSNQNYQVAEKGNSDQTKNATNVYVAGFPLPGPTVKQRIYRFLSGSISGRLPTPESGYELVYEVAALPGMSGGPILNEQGQVVGINGLAIPDARTGAVSVVGIPINTYSRLALVERSQIPSNSKSDYYFHDQPIVRYTPTPTAQIPSDSKSDYYFYDQPIVGYTPTLTDPITSYIQDRLNQNLREAIARMKTSEQIKR